MQCIYSPVRIYKYNPNFLSFYNMKKLILTMIACLAMTAQAKIIKRIKSPEALLCLNVYGGELKANEVVMTDTATTIRFSLTYHKGNYFCIAQWAALVDEDGNRYPVHSIEGMKFGEWITVPDSGVKDFTLHFAPMPKNVKIFDFIEGDGDNMFKLLGIHDTKMKIKVPTMKELSDANPYTVPADWLRTDTITVKGRIEGYDENTFGFSYMQFFNYDVLQAKDAVMTMNINEDGTFEKKFCYSSLVLSAFYTHESKNGFDKIPFFARPGETIDITVRKNNSGGYECIYNNGSSKEVSRLLESYDNYNGARSASDFRGKFAEFTPYAMQKLDGVLYYLNKNILRYNYTPLETQLALAIVQTNLAGAVMDYAMMHEDDLQKREGGDGRYTITITDSVEYAKLTDPESYSLLRLVDFNNPLLLSTGSTYYFLINRLCHCRYLWSRYDGETYNDAKRRMETTYAALGELLGRCGDDNTLTAQICAFESYKNQFKFWQDNENAMKSLSEDQKKNYNRNSCLSVAHPLYLSTFTHPYIHSRVEQFYTDKTTARNLTWELPKNNAAADVIRSIAARFPGRYLYIDFWGMNCGPCRGEIQKYKEKRAEIARRGDVKLIFIAGERTTEGSPAYRNYVNEWLNGEEAICVTDNMFYQLQELFRFSGIPHKEVITPDGRVVDSDISVHMYDFDNTFKAMKEKVE